jgi:hypothetical protein
MKIELKTVIDQLTEALSLEDGVKVAAMIDFDDPKVPEGKLLGWTLTKVFEDGSTKIYDEKLKYNTLKELFDNRRSFPRVKK